MLKRRRTAVAAACACLAVLPACDSGVEVGDASTTTAVPSTEAPASTTTTARKAVPKPNAKPSLKATTKTTLRQDAGDDGDAIDVTPQDIEPLLLMPASPWRREDDAAFGTGPADLDQAAADEVEDVDGSVAEAREFLESIGFLAGYSRAWEVPPASSGRGATEFSFLLAGVYAFIVPEGATAYFEHRVSVYDALASEAGWERITFGDVPRSRAWMGGDDEDGRFAFGIFAKGHFFGQVMCRTNGRTVDYRTCAREHAEVQFGRL